MKQIKFMVLILSIILSYTSVMTAEAEQSSDNGISKEAAADTLSSVVEENPVSAQAKLKGYLNLLDSYEANFQQQLVSSARRLMETTSGRFLMKRPDRFRWHIQDPYEQVIIADGKSIYSIDMDLEQVTIADIDESLGNSPIMLLSRKNSRLEDFFKVESIRSDDQMERFILKPLDNSSNFEFVQLGFKDGVLSLIELNDSLGQITIISLSNIRTNPILSDQEFIYKPQEDFDLIDSRVRQNSDNS